MKNPPKGSRCEAGTPAMDRLGHPHIEKCGKPATMIVKDAGFDAYVCDKCGQSIERRRKEAPHARPS